MAHFAQLDENNIVINVVVINNDDILDESGKESEEVGIKFCQSLFGGGTWLQTSYNGKIRKHYAGLGYKYDKELDAFIGPKPYPSWVLNENVDWVPPIPMPPPKEGFVYDWNEETLSWVEIPITPLET